RRPDRALAERAAVELPHRAEAAVERAAARRLDQPHGAEEEAVVLPAIPLDEVAGRQRNRVEAGPVLERRRRRPALRRLHAEARRCGASAPAGTISSPSSTQIASISGASSGPGNAAAA